MDARILVVGLLLALLAAPGVQATEWSEDGDGLRILLLTAPPGHRDPSAWYGHTGLVVEDDAGRSAYYGYRLDTSIAIGEVKRAVRTGLGESSMQLVEMPVGDILADYASQGREVRLLELQLPAASRAGFAATLSDAAAAGEWVAYHTMTDNCSTRIRDLLDDALDGRLQEATEATVSGTLRSLTRPYLDHAPMAAVTMRFFAGDGIDQPVTTWEGMFLPLELEAAVKSLHLGDGPGGRPLAGKETVLVEPADAAFTPAPPLRAAGPLLLLSLVGAGGLVALTSWGAGRPVVQRGLAMSLFLLAVVLTPAILLMTLLWNGVLGMEYAHNENLLVIPPTVIAYLPLSVLALSGRPGAWRMLHTWSLASALFACAAVVLKVLPWFDQANHVGIALFVPLHVAIAVAVRQVHDSHVEPDGRPGVATTA